ncbi:MAG TPA: DNA gyrase inhibitor YacG [Bryobacteraceae bacterium]
MLCPICRKKVPRDGGFMPFCSERCQTVDLGNWAAEKYRISTPASPEDLENGQPANGRLANGQDEEESGE